jgi:hypothetical protein
VQSFVTVLSLYTYMHLWRGFSIGRNVLRKGVADAPQHVTISAGPAEPQNTNYL